MRDSTWCAVLIRTLFVVLLALACSALGSGCSRATKSSANGGVLRFARATAEATRLDVSRPDLGSRVAISAPSAVTWRPEGATATMDGAGVLQIAAEGAFTVLADVPVTPGVDYVVRMLGSGEELALEAKKSQMQQANVRALGTWDRGVARQVGSLVEVRLKKSAAQPTIELRIVGRGNASVRQFEVREASRASPLELMSSEDLNVRGFVDASVDQETKRTRESLLAVGTSAYEWRLPPASEPRVVDVETAHVRRHGEAASGPIVMKVQLHDGGEWRDVYRIERGVPGDEGGWVRTHIPVGNADAIRFATSPSVADRPTVTVAWGGPVLRPAARGSRPDVVLITIDALRADRLGVYGHGGGLTPTIDRLGKAGVVFEEARAQRGQTWESLTAIASATWPESVGVYHRGDNVDRGHRSVADGFADAGYLTARVGDLLMPAGHLGSMDIEEETRRDAPSMVRLLRLFEEEPDRPIFVWIHLAATHYPYNPLPEFRPADLPPKLMTMQLFMDAAGATGTDASRAELARLYDACIRQSDAFIERALPPLVRADRPGGPALVAVSADHGSLQGERGIWFMHSTMLRPVLRVPLVFWWPGHLEPRRNDRLVRTIDIGPTLLDYAGLSPQGFTGQSLRALMEGERSPGRINIVGHPSEILAVENDRYKMVANPKSLSWSWPKYGRDLSGPQVELYDWRRDPDETHNLAEEAPLLVGEMWRQVSDARSTVQRPISAETARLLQQAGYANPTGNAGHKPE